MSIIKDNEAIIKKLYADGLTLGDIEAIYKTAAAEKEKEAARKQEIQDAKEELTLSFIDYLSALGVLTEESTDEEIDKYAKLIDRTISTWDKLFTEGKVTVRGGYSSSKDLDPLLKYIFKF